MYKAQVHERRPKIELNIKILDLNIWTMALTVWHDISRAHQNKQWHGENREREQSSRHIHWCYYVVILPFFVLFVLYALHMDSIASDECSGGFFSNGTSCCVWVKDVNHFQLIRSNIVHTHTQANTCTPAISHANNPTYMHITSYLHHLCNNKVGTCTDLDSLPVEHSANSLFSVNVDKERRTL